MMSFRKLLYVVLAVLATCAPQARAQGSDRLDAQYWIGDMATSTPTNPTLGFLVTLWREGEVWRGTLDIPPTTGIGGAWGVEFIDVLVTDSQFELTQPPANLEAEPNVFLFSRDLDRPDTAIGRVMVSGSVPIDARMWKVSEQEAEGFMPRRPQVPKRPFPYEQRHALVPNTRNGERMELPGMLTLPPGEGPFPAVVLVGGYGPLDMDHGSMGHRPFLILADRLARAGIATLRVQDRPLARPGLASRTQLTIEQLGAEAAERIEWLAGHNRIDPARIGLLGLNEGGTAAAVAAQKAGSGVKCLVLLAPQAITGLEQLRGEFSSSLKREGESAEFVARRTQSFLKPYELLAAEAPREEVVDALFAEMTMQREARRQQLGEASPEIVRGLADQQFLIMNTPEFRHDLKYDPAEVFTQLKVPALAILGGMDSRLDPAVNAPALERSLGARAGVETTIRIGPNLNHRLQPSTGGGMDEVEQIEVTLDEDVLSDVVKFLTRMLRPAGNAAEGNQ